MARLKRVGVLFSAKLLSIAMAFVGLLCGILYSFGGAIHDLLTIGLNAGTALAFLALIGMPAVFAAAGFVAGALEALIYNSLVRWFDGIEVDIEEDGPATSR